MKKDFLLFTTVVLSSLTAYASFASEVSRASPPQNQLKQINEKSFMDKEGRVINYPCNMGGEPLAIYSVVDGKPITSKSTFYPVYLKEGYQASPLTIPDFETTEEVSNNDLIIQTINPAVAYLSFDLTRKDGFPFYVNTANFPVVDVIAGDEGTLEKYVSVFNVSINQAPAATRYTDLPVYNYSFAQDLGLYVFSEVKQIKASIASWNQNSDWTDGRLGSNYSNISYRFAPIEIKNPGKITYDGFGFWICGSNKKPVGNKVVKKTSYADKRAALTM